MVHFAGIGAVTLNRDEKRRLPRRKEGHSGIRGKIGGKRRETGRWTERCNNVTGIGPAGARRWGTLTGNGAW